LRERVSVVVNCPPGEVPADEWARRHPIRASVRKAINNSALLRNLESRVRGNNGASGAPTDEYTFVPGETAGFSNILECAGQLPAVATTGIKLPYLHRSQARTN